MHSFQGAGRRLVRTLETVLGTNCLPNIGEIALNAYVSAYACTALEPYVDPVRCYSDTTPEKRVAYYVQ